jgi:catechol 2,3-dioxygenase-like lactoylglutathione lyase family enzyme
MISGAHVILYSRDPEADRAFFREVLGFPSVDAGHGWLIFALPPAEAAIHPADGAAAHELYFMCDDLAAEMSSLRSRGVSCTPVQELRWGSLTRMRLPGGGQVGLYQPRHPTALSLGARKGAAKPVARKGAAKPVARKGAAKPVARKGAAKPVARKAAVRKPARQASRPARRRP